MENQEKAENTQHKKAPMSHEERMALAAKLDKELDEFIDSLPRREQSTGPPDENWLEEFDKHPFFMKKVPEPGEEMHPLYEGLQQLKYDPNENTPEELATSYKDDGNFNFKHKNYRLAVIGYTEGIKVKCGIPEIEASLHNNRSAAHWYLQNYRSSLRDAETALKHNPTHEKAQQRAANCCFKIQKYEECIAYCDKILDSKKIAEILELRKQAVSKKQEFERNERKKKAAAKKRSQEEDKLLGEVNKLGVKTVGELTLASLQPQFPGIADHQVYLNPDNILVFPVVLLYPQYKTMDFIQQFPVNSTFQEQLEIIFTEKPDWDERNEYKVDNLDIFFEFDNKTRVQRVEKHQILSDVLKDKRYILTAGTPYFHITVHGSQAEKEFLSSY